MADRTTHPTIDDLCDHFSVHGRKLSDAEKEEITAHLEICTDCKIIGEKIRIVDDAWQEASRKDFQEPPEVTALVQHMKDWVHNLCALS